MPKNNAQYKHLLSKWTEKHRKQSREIFDKHKEAFEYFSNNTKQLALGSVAGLFLLTSPIIPQIPSSFSAVLSNPQSIIDKKVFLVFDLKNVLPSDVRPLNLDEESKVGDVLSRTFGIKVSAELLGKRLNTQYGYIGQEQHLARYPGDNMLTHFSNPDSAKDYWDYGMAPGLGAFRYFSDSKESMTTLDEDRERYYIAVQTFLSSGFSENTKDYMDFFKYRKMLVVNPNNGKSIVADIADSGPAAWTGKQLGGSPEVMKYLERFDGSQKGPVLFYFIDDPDNKIPLGPISL